MNNRIAVFGILLIGVGVAKCSNNASFVAEYELNSRRIAAKLMNCTYTFAEIRHPITGEPSQTEGAISFRNQSYAIRLASQQFDNKGDQTSNFKYHHIQDIHYAATVKIVEQRYLLRSINVKNKDANADGFLPIHHVAACHIGCHGVLYSELFKAPTTKIHRIQRQQFADQEVDAVFFECPHPRVAGAKVFQISYFRSDSLPVCIGCHVCSTGFKTKLSEQFFDYEEKGENIIPKKISCWLIDPKTGSRGEIYWEQTVSDFEANPSLDESIFYLSSYGLPEPVGVTAPGGNRRWIWFLVASLGLAIIALGVRWFVRRDKD
jgi:hypothetical protein